MWSKEYVKNPKLLYFEYKSKVVLRINQLSTFKIS